MVDPSDLSRATRPYCYNLAMEERIIELETRVAYQEKLLCDLDEVVQAFAKRVEKAEQSLRRLKSAQFEHQDEMEPHNTQPPHY